MINSIPEYAQKHGLKIGDRVRLVIKEPYWADPGDPLVGQCGSIIGWEDGRPLESEDTFVVLFDGGREDTVLPPCLDKI